MAVIVGGDGGKRRTWLNGADLIAVYDPTTVEPMHYQTPEDEFRTLMAGDHPRLRRSRALLARLPTGPRCKTCNAPFGFPGSLVSRAMGRERFPKNPRFCQMCFNWLTVAGIRGADIELSVLFSDVRDSVGLAERLGPAAYTALIDRFYKVASNGVMMANGIADRFVGDAVISLFIPGMTGPDHTGAALAAARAIVKGTGHPSDPWIAAGVAVHRGVAFLGGVGEQGQLHDFTALGDPVNTAARLASGGRIGRDPRQPRRRRIDRPGRERPRAPLTRAQGQDAAARRPRRHECNQAVMTHSNGQVAGTA